MSRAHDDGGLRVLVLAQHYAPEVTAGAFRVQAFADGLNQRGHSVRVLCPVPNHPTGVVEAGYGERLAEHRDVAGSDVTYLRVMTARQKTFSKRLAYYGSYAALASTFGAVQRRPDVVLASSPPLTVPAVGALLALRHRAPLVLDIRDLWPDSALELGEVGPGRLLSSMQQLERWVYRRSAAIVTANDAFRRRIEERAPAGSRVEVIANGTTQAWLEAGEAEVSRSSLGLPDDRFVWAYAGNIGLAHGLEVAVDAARLLGDEYRLLVIGEGARRGDLERRAAQAAPSLVEFRGLMPPAQAASHLRAADALLVSERQGETVSAKLYDVCAVGRPVIAACRGELRRLVERERIALAVPHGDAEALAAAVRRLRSDPDLGERLSEDARSFARAHLRERQAERLARLLESTVALG